jgi:3-deoxy-D-manno-octulosonate 8-phosphate phosphatase (KDO 8-P phosphatase)
MGKFKEELNQVRAFIFDVDGVLAKSEALIGEGGEIIRTTNTKDGYSIFRACQLGYKVAIITGGNSDNVKTRFENLGVEVYSGVGNKLEVFRAYIKKYAIKPEMVMYMGDDIPDYPVMSQIGVPVCPNDAVPEIKQVAHYISDKNGGEGCVRDVIEQVLRVHGNWEVGEALKNSKANLDKDKKW